MPPGGLVSFDLRRRISAHATRREPARRGACPFRFLLSFFCVRFAYKNCGETSRLARFYSGSGGDGQASGLDDNYTTKGRARFHLCRIRREGPPTTVCHAAPIIDRAPRILVLPGSPRFPAGPRQIQPPGRTTQTGGAQGTRLARGKRAQDAGPGIGESSTSCAAPHDLGTIVSPSYKGEGTLAAPRSNGGDGECRRSKGQSVSI